LKWIFETFGFYLLRPMSWSIFTPYGYSNFESEEDKHPKHHNR